ncbi:MAG: tRNA (adenosine(37)-N6)-threonylcarbamoyltransferase complex dimerization subunit type 1 TsaB, partial [Treponema sp. RIFOXYC1_FULL_61_9]
MNVLALDTATDILSVALSTDEGVLSFEMDAGRRHSERLMELVDALFRVARADPAGIDLVACMQGPGSFTGLRIGMATAKGIAAARGIPLISVPTLDCIAAPHAAWPGWVVPLIDAKKGRWYAATFLRGSRRCEDFDAESEALAALLPGEEPVFVAGPDAVSGAAALSRFISPSRLVADPSPRRGAGKELLAAAVAAFASGAAGDAPDAGLVYLRRS